MRLVLSGVNIDDTRKAKEIFVTHFSCLDILSNLIYEMHIQRTQDFFFMRGKVKFKIKMYKNN